MLQSCEDCEGSEVAEVGSQRQSASGGEESDTEDDRDRDSDRDRGGDGDGDDDSNSNVEVGTEPAIDVFRDARKLYPWQGRQKELLRRFRESIEED